MRRRRRCFQCEKAPSVTAVLLLIMGVVFVAFRVIGIAMPVLPL
jgi:hypothetical protein